jgi:hypothetical protein
MHADLKELLEIESLLERLKAISTNFQDNQPEITWQDNLNQVIRISLGKLHTDPEKLKEYEKLQEDRKAQQNPRLNISVSPIEICSLIQGLIYLKQSIHAHQYVRNSIGHTSNERRWSDVSEIMLIKNPDEKLRRHGFDELCEYSLHVDNGLTPREASHKVFKKFNFPTQEACDKWLIREIAKQGENSVFANLPSLNTWTKI